MSGPPVGLGLSTGRPAVLFEGYDGRRVSTQLTDYGRMDAFMDRLMQYEGVDIKLYNSEAGFGFPAEV